MALNLSAEHPARVGVPTMTSWALRCGQREVVGWMVCICEAVSSCASSYTITSNEKPSDAESVRVEKQRTPPLVSSKLSWPVFDEALLTKRLNAAGAFGSPGRMPSTLRNLRSISMVVP